MGYGGLGSSVGLNITTAAAGPDEEAGRQAKRYKFGDNLINYGPEWFIAVGGGL